MLPRPDDVLGSYRVLQPLGEGGCAAVFEAAHTETGERVALKVLLPDIAENVPGMAERFAREIDVAKRLEHEHVAKVHAFGEDDDGVLWMAMELVRGRDLEQMLREEGAMPLERAREVMIQILSGLACAHEKLIAHRDMKPSNIMLVDGDSVHVKLVDFGIGKALGADEDASIQELTETFGHSFGSPHYMAPEQLKRLGGTPASDVYACGLILAELLTGERAVDADTVFQIYAKQAFDAVALPDELEGTQVAAVIQRATEKDPEKRFPTAKEFLAALRGLGAEASEGPEPPPRRSHGRALVGGALLALLVLLAWVLATL